MITCKSHIQIWGRSTVGMYVVNRRASFGVKEHTFGMRAHLCGVRGHTPGAAAGDPLCRTADYVAVRCVF
jgi:hypothetical protein